MNDNNPREYQLSSWLRWKGKSRKGTKRACIHLDDVPDGLDPPSEGDLICDGSMAWTIDGLGDEWWADQYKNKDRRQYAYVSEWGIAPSCDGLNPRWIGRIHCLDRDTFRLRQGGRDSWVTRTGAVDKELDKDPVERRIEVRDATEEEIVAARRDERARTIARVGRMATARTRRIRWERDLERILPSQTGEWSVSRRHVLVDMSYEVVENLAHLSSVHSRTGEKSLDRIVYTRGDEMARGWRIVDTHGSVEWWIPSAFFDPDAEERAMDRIRKAVQAAKVAGVSRRDVVEMLEDMPTRRGIIDLMRVEIE